MPPTRTIFWDVGGVLLTNGYDHVERKAVLDHFGVDPAPVEERHPSANDLWEKGEISVWEFLDRTIFFEPRNFTPEQFFEGIKQQSKLLPNTALPVLQSLAGAKDYTTVMLNNESAELHDYRVEKFGLRELFKVSLCSAYIGLRKPGKEIFELALRVMQVAPGDAVFIDDRELNCESARAVGMTAIQYESPEQLARELNAVGVEF